MNSKDVIYAMMDGDNNIFIVDDPVRVSKLNALVKRLRKQGMADEQMTPYLMKVVDPVNDKLRTWLKHHTS
jgi:type II secretory pathway component GspD/PulD (secretin)